MKRIALLTLALSLGASAAFGGIRYNGIAANGIAANGIVANGIVANGMPINGMPATTGDAVPLVAQTVTLADGTLLNVEPAR